MIKWSAYWRLLRFNRPAGTLLLWYPTAWALWIANEGFPPFKLLFLFFIGTVLMRAAGCVFNDIADRHIDKHVARTKLRPLTSGEVSLPEAFVLLIMLLLGALEVAINLPSTCFYLAVIALLITLLYPFCKRFLKAPQMVLGLAFSMGIPMAYSASGASLNNGFFILFLINFAWILAYDTMYAMTDREDDLKIGVKSTAIYFASYDRLIIGLLLVFLHGLWLYWALASHARVGFYGCWFAAALILIYQQKLINKRVPQDCFKAFLVSVYYGLLMWLAVGVALLDSA
ncbi:4-hydroxybenzoate octaprenyltransferase [Legionella maioricensis]|uniref:4-hydroxybenzoate octaprenyltransferase n=1 Tax=Legionella maioricensis TaxID=2896528 RepID=A0A9X2D0N7_9GAMM|nr:4-hydroxybenzoate octaprenyltransferase [Legionella maioricensis]MCL9687119.1 4-hydroxybenzoate octaprenyltransferase [Legionella maioricensis]